MSASLNMLTETDNAGTMIRSNALERHRIFKWCWKDVKTDGRTRHPTTYGLNDID
jgi:hypothetical protein